MCCCGERCHHSEPMVAKHMLMNHYTVSCHVTSARNLYVQIGIVFGFAFLLFVSVHGPWNLAQRSDSIMKMERAITEKSDELKRAAISTIRPFRIRKSSIHLAEGVIRVKRGTGGAEDLTMTISTRTFHLGSAHVHKLHALVVYARNGQEVAQIASTGSGHDDVNTKKYARSFASSPSQVPAVMFSF